MAKLDKIKILFRKPQVVLVQSIFSEVAAGLGISWFVLMVFEIWRSGMASLYLDLNLILVLALITWALSIVRLSYK